MDEEIAERVYDTLLGNLLPEFCLPWVENIFVPGYPCLEEYGKMLNAYARLRIRLGAVNEDEDAEVMINSLLEHGKIIMTGDAETVCDAYSKKY